MKHAWLGIDLGGTKIAATVVDADGGVHVRGRAESRRAEGAEAVLARVVQLARRAADDARVSGCDLRAVGVGFAGLVDVASGRVTSSVILPGWDDFPLAERLSSALDLPVVLDNDANCAGLADHVARGAPAQGTSVLFTLGTGIGGAIIHAGRLVRGHAGVSGEFGHMTVELEGEPCWCTNRGCLHTLASGSAIAARAWRFACAGGKGSLSALASAPTLEIVAAAEREGDPYARQAIHDGARALGAGIATVVQILNPELVVLAGGVLGLGDEYLAHVRAEVEARTFAESRVGLRIEPTELGPDAGALGAAALAHVET